MPPKATDPPCQCLPPPHTWKNISKPWHIFDPPQNGDQSTTIHHNSTTQKTHIFQNHPQKRPKKDKKSPGHRRDFSLPKSKITR
jgi:hypothetical protein